jgi:hypothetical protein
LQNGQPKGRLDWSSGAATRGAMYNYVNVGKRRILIATGAALLTIKPLLPLFCRRRMGLEKKEE